MGAKLEKAVCFWSIVSAKGSSRQDEKMSCKMQPLLPEQTVKSATSKANAAYNHEVKLSHLILLCLCLVY